MGLPLFDAHNDPGPSFVRFAEMANLTLPPTNADLSAHATTVVAVRYSDGVVMVGDRQATSY